MRWLGENGRRRRLEAQACAWVAKINDDRDRHEAALRRWIGSNSERARIYNETYRAFREAQGPAGAIYGTVRERQTLATGRGFRAIPYTQLLAMAAILVAVGVGVSLGFSRLTGDRLVQTAMSNAGEAILATTTGKPKTFLLRDGSRVRLGPDARIDVRFDPARRLLTLLHGRARFAVAHDADRPFIVAAGGGTVTAHGTVFEVAYDKRVSVRLISGAIEVRYPSTSKSAAVVRQLTAGQQVSFDATAVAAPQPPSPADATGRDQVSQMKTFDDVRVSAIIDEANRYAARKIVLSAPEVGEREVFIDVDIRNASDVAHKLAILLGLVVDNTKPDIIALIPPRQK